MKAVFFPFALSCLCVALLPGCGKEEAAPVEVPPPAAEAPSAPATPAAVQRPAPAAPAPQQASPAAVQQAESILKAKQYDQAATRLIELAASARKLPPAQAGPLNHQILQLQMELQSAAASGEPGAAQALQRVAAARK